MIIFGESLRLGQQTGGRICALNSRTVEKMKNALQRAKRGLAAALDAIDEVEKLLPEESSDEQPVVLCLTPGCENKARYRGLCGGHYNKARTEINAGIVTEEQLVDSNLMLAQKKAGRPKQPTFSELVKQSWAEMDMKEKIQTTVMAIADGGPYDGSALSREKLEQLPRDELDFLFSALKEREAAVASGRVLPPFDELRNEPPPPGINKNELITQILDMSTAEQMQATLAIMNSIKATKKKKA